jgi:hypothetical protein
MTIVEGNEEERDEDVKDGECGDDENGVLAKSNVL